MSEQPPFDPIVGCCERYANNQGCNCRKKQAICEGTLAGAEARMIVARDYEQVVCLEPRQCAAVLDEIDRLRIATTGLTDQTAVQSDLISPHMERRSTQGVSLGDKVKKTGGDYFYSGVIVGVIHKQRGAIRYVVEDDRGMLFIFRAEQLEVES